MLCGDPAAAYVPSSYFLILLRLYLPAQLCNIRNNYYKHTAFAFTSYICFIYFKYFEGVWELKIIFPFWLFPNTPLSPRLIDMRTGYRWFPVKCIFYTTLCPACTVPFFYSFFPTKYYWKRIGSHRFAWCEQRYWRFVVNNSST